MKTINCFICYLFYQKYGWTHKKVLLIQDRSANAGSDAQL